MSKIKCSNCGEYGHYARDCPKACDKTNIMLDLDNSGVNEACAMMCMEVQCEDGGKDLILYGDQGVSTEVYDKAMYGELTKTQREDEEEVMCNIALCTNDSGEEKKAT